MSEHTTRQKAVDVLVIGAGIIGAATAYYLTQSKKRVLIVDVQAPMSGTTSQAASVLIRHRADAQRQAMMDETFSCIQAFEASEPFSTGYMQTGCLHIGGSDVANQKAQDVHAMASRYGRNANLLDAEAVMKKAPWITVPKAALSCFDQEDGYVDAYSLGNAFLKRALQGGAELWQGTGVEQILVDGSGGAKGVRLSDGREIQASALVLASGPWSTALSADLGIMLPMAPVRSQYWLARSAALKVDRGSAIAVIPDAAAYTRPDGNDILFGYRDRSAVSKSPQDLPLDLHAYRFEQSDACTEPYGDLEEAFAAVSPYVPGLSEAGIAHYMAGVSSYTYDGQYILGGLKSIKNLFIGTGCSGAGIAMSAGFGRVLSELACGTKPFIDIAPYAPDRMPDANPFCAEFQHACALARANKR